MFNIRSKEKEATVSRESKRNKEVGGGRKGEEEHAVIIIFKFYLKSGE